MSEPIEQTLLVERDGPVAILTLNRPKQLNALSVSLRVNIVRTIRDLSAGTDVRAIVLTGSGRAFSAGVDLKEAGQKGFSLGVGDRKSAEPAPDMDLAAAFAACPWPVIGAINGFAITGGFELALMCDVLLASTEAKFADTHSRVGLMPVWGLSQKLPRLIGAGRAKELSLTGNYLEAATAERWGLVNRVLSPEDLLPAARKLAHEMASVEGGLLKRMKAVIDDGLALPLPEALKMEIERGSANNSAITPDAAEESRKSAMARGREQAT
jgi:enoyl-CoA hydratase